MMKKSLLALILLAVMGRAALAQVAAGPQPSPEVPRNQFFYTTLLNPTGAASSTKVMMGMGSALQYTPRSTGCVTLTMTGWLSNSTVLDGMRFLPYYGLVSGGVPSNGAVLKGTSPLSQEYFLDSAVAGQRVSSPISDIEITGLTVGGVYWFDVGLGVITGGTASIDLVSTSIYEHSCY